MEAPSICVPDFKHLFESAPGISLVLNRQLRIVAASDGFTEATKTRRDEVLGLEIFEVFPAHPEDTHGLQDWAASLERVLTTGVAEAMGLQRYDLRKSEDDQSDPRYLRSINQPVLAPDGSVSWIIYQAEDVTEFIQSAGKNLDLEKPTFRPPGASIHPLKEAANAARQESDGLRSQLEKCKTELKEAQRLTEAALQARENQLYSFVQQAPVSIAMFDRNLNYLAVSQRWNKDFRQTDLIGRNHYEIFSDLPGSWKLFFQRALEGETLSSEAELWSHADGSKFWFHWNLSPWLDANGQIGGLLMTCNDITPRILADQHLRLLQRSTTETAALLDTLQHHAPIGIGLVDCEYRFRRVNEKLAALNGMAAQAHLGQSIAEIAPALWPRVEEALRQVFELGEPVVESELIFERGEAERCHLLMSFYPVRNQETIAGAGMIALDVTEQKRLEREILEISEREQCRLGQDIHDGLGQELAGIALLSKVLANQLRIQDHPQSTAATNISSYLKCAIDSTRRLAKGLYPIELKRAGLIYALEDLVQITGQRLGICCQLLLQDKAQLFEPSEAIHLYRMIQESIGNAIKHGQATQIVIELPEPNREYIFQVTDNGRGFKKPVDATGMGLHLMHYRAKIIGAKIEVTQPPDGGCRVICRRSAALQPSGKALPQAPDPKRISTALRL